VGTPTRHPSGPAAESRALSDATGPAQPILHSGSGGLSPIASRKQSSESLAVNRQKRITRWAMAGVGEQPQQEGGDAVDGSACGSRRTANGIPCQTVVEEAPAELLHGQQDSPPKAMHKATYEGCCRLVSDEEGVYDTCDGVQTGADAEYTRTAPDARRVKLEVVYATHEDLQSGAAAVVYTRASISGAAATADYIYSNHDELQAADAEYSQTVPDTMEERVDIYDTYEQLQGP